MLRNNAAALLALCWYWSSKGVGSLLNKMTQQDKLATLKQALETLGFVYKEMSHQDLAQEEVNATLLTVVQRMSLVEHDSEVRVASIKALCKALKFPHTNFEVERERNYIMKVVDDTTISKKVETPQAVFEFLVVVASVYYEVLKSYLQILFWLTSKVIKGNEKIVAAQTIELLSSTCNDESIVKVWLLEEERLLDVSSLLEQDMHKILMKSPY